jgi:integrase
VKGLGISCTIDEWDQSQQRIKRSNKSYSKYNKTLAFIEDELTKIEEKSDVNDKDIDIVVSAAKKGIATKDIIIESDKLINLLKLKYQNTIDLGLSNNTSKNYEYYIKKLERFEKYYNKHINIQDLEENIYNIQQAILIFCRKVESNKDSSIKTFFDSLNTSIKHYNDINNKNIPYFKNKDNNYKNEIKEIIYLTKDELSSLYKYVYDPTEEMQKVARPDKQDIKFINYFLFRCFSGMRIREMNKHNINKSKLVNIAERSANKDVHSKFNGFSYIGYKNNKKVTIPYIKNYLFELATELNWDFPDLTNQNDLITHIKKEQSAVSNALDNIYGNSIRKIEIYKDRKVKLFKLSEVVTSHTARKTFAYLIYNQNKDILFVKNCLGHSNINTTQKYLGIDYVNDEYENISLDI